MAFREVSVVQIKELLRRWLNGEGERPIASGAGVARATARNYIAAAVELGVDRAGGEGQLTDELIGQICERVRPHRLDGHGESWRKLAEEEQQIKVWVSDGLTVVKIGVLLRRRGVAVPHRTLARFAVERCGAGRRTTTLRVDDPPPGRECQVDFGRLGLVADGERRRVCWALIFTACYSRHQFIWPTFCQTVEEVIAGFEAAWGYFSGIFPVVIPDSMKAIVDEADNLAPRLNDTFLEYAQSRGFVIDAARIGKARDKPKVERAVPYGRRNFFAGESFRDLGDVRARAQTWCTQTAGLRIHGTTQLRPLEVFRAEEQPLLLPHPGLPFDVPKWTKPKVHRDFHCEVDKALYSAPHRLIGQRLKARRDATTVKLYFRGELVKLHPRKPPGQRSTDRADLPTGTEIYATRDLDRLRAVASTHGEAIGIYATAILDTPLPWTRMRQVYRLLGLVKKWGADRVEQACRTALDAEAVDINLVSRMLERAREGTTQPTPAQLRLLPGRYARDASEFALNKKAGR
ncbi:MAG TPA: IS21 family transposase [Acidimicrobiales bacterium]|nr:IS21 family transposase [Acidimicrobiales bacterium]